MSEGRRSVAETARAWAPGVNSRVAGCADRRSRAQPSLGRCGWVGHQCRWVGELGAKRQLADVAVTREWRSREQPKSNQRRGKSHEEACKTESELVEGRRRSVEARVGGRWRWWWRLVACGSEESAGGHLCVSEN